MIDRGTHEQNVRWWKSEHPSVNIPEHEWEQLYNLGNLDKAGQMIYVTIMSSMGILPKFVKANGFDWDSINRYHGYLNEEIEYRIDIERRRQHYGN
jgi:hypothetical protein